MTRVFFAAHRWWWLAAAAALLGVSLFWLWPQEAAIETDIFVPVKLVNLPAGLVISGPGLSGVEVRVRGRRAVLEVLVDQGVSLDLDLADLTEGLHSVEIRTESLALPRGVVVLDYQPRIWTVPVEREIQRRLPVQATLTGKAAAGYRISGVTVKPDWVVVHGAESALNGVIRIPTKPIDVDGVTESFKREIALDLPGGISPAVELEGMQAEVTVEAQTLTRTFQDIGIVARGSPYACRIEPSRLSIEVRGPALVLEKLDVADDIEVYVDLRGLAPGRHVTRATITLPVKTTLVGVRPETFTVTIHDVRSPGP